jgi:hypothetical protein
VGAIISVDRYIKRDNYKTLSECKIHNKIFLKACTNISKQRLKSLNSRGRRRTLGALQGYTDNSFHMELSRGYSSVVPRVVSMQRKLHDYGPFLKNASYAKFLGNSGLTYWRGKSVILPMDPLNYIAWYLNIIPKQVKKILGEIDALYCALPSYIGSFPTLTRFSGSNEGYQGFVNEKLLKIDKFLPRLRLPTNVIGATKKDIFSAKVTPDTHPGLVTKKMTEHFVRTAKSGRSGVIKKADLIHSTVADLMANWDRISQGRYGVCFGTYLIGSREKISKAKIGEIVEARPLFIPEIADLLLGSTWLEVLKTNWQSSGLFSSEIWLGHSDTKMLYYR